MASFQFSKAMKKETHQSPAKNRPVEEDGSEKKKTQMGNHTDKAAEKTESNSKAHLKLNNGGFGDFFHFFFT